MNLGSKEDVVYLIKNSGATLYDIAAHNNTTPEVVATYLKNLNIDLPSMALEGSFDFIKMLQRNLRMACKAEDLIQDPYGGILHIPKNEFGDFLYNAESIYKNAHGDGFIDVYTNEVLTKDYITFVDGNHENLLISNIEVLGENSRNQRFNFLLGPVTETFHMQTKYFNFDIEISRPYDQFVGGTYNPDYVHNLFFTWVGYPLNLYFVQNIEDEEIFKCKTPLYIAWWAWIQLGNYALLKGIKSITVGSKQTYSMDQLISSPEDRKKNTKADITTMAHSATVKDTDLLHCLQNMIKKSHRKSDTDCKKTGIQTSM